MAGEKDYTLMMNDYRLSAGLLLVAHLTAGRDAGASYAIDLKALVERKRNSNAPNNL